MAEQLTFPAEWVDRLEPSLPQPRPEGAQRPFVTLTFATSLDSGLSLAPGLRTRLSGPDSKAMTHYLRSRHDAILIGIGTQLADDPALNCRIAGAQRQPRPILIDPHLRWKPSVDDKVLQVSRDGAARAPYVITALAQGEIPSHHRAVLDQHGGKYITIASTASGPDTRHRFDWQDIFAALAKEGLASVMVEGGAQLINSLLEPKNHGLVDSVIVTIAPVWLGQGSVTVSPDRIRDDHGTALPVARLSKVSWHPFGEDVVLCGTLRG